MAVLRPHLALTVGIQPASTEDVLAARERLVAAGLAAFEEMDTTYGDCAEAGCGCAVAGTESLCCA